MDNELCTACGSCEDACPNGAISHKGKVYKVDPKKCTDCEGVDGGPQCEDVCPGGAAMAA
ncbi:4Fe-4S binding protein [Consotaella salsifontis]|uniref:4Fe-4S binding protein n=1 Tax=Consotaella salsifontis TaxID=1365950 RepID=UPI003CCA4146